MFGHPTIPRSSTDFLSDFPTSPDVKPLNFPLCSLTQLTESESFDSLSEALHSDTSHRSYNSPSSRASCCTQKPSFMQRSVGSHYLQKNQLHFHSTWSLNEFIDSVSGPVRRVFSTSVLDQGLHRRRRSESPLSNESNAIMEGMSRACRYSPEEKKERIERYRTKRNLRNFNKKIKYACRKTLADSRPRTRGRFARNEGIEKNPQVEWSYIGGEEEEEDEEDWINFLDSLPRT